MTVMWGTASDRRIVSRCGTRAPCGRFPASCAMIRLDEDTEKQSASSWSGVHDIAPVTAAKSSKIAHYAKEAMVGIATFILLKTFIVFAMALLFTPASRLNPHAEIVTDIMDFSRSEVSTSRSTGSRVPRTSRTAVVTWKCRKTT